MDFLFFIDKAKEIQGYPEAPLHGWVSRRIDRVTFGASLKNPLKNTHINLTGKIQRINIRGNRMITENILSTVGLNGGFKYGVSGTVGKLGCASNF